MDAECFHFKPRDEGGSGFLRNIGNNSIPHCAVIKENITTIKSL
jgi:hypothetical protein